MGLKLGGAYLPGGREGKQLAQGHSGKDKAELAPPCSVWGWLLGPRLLGRWQLRKPSCLHLKVRRLPLLPAGPPIKQRTPPSLFQRRWACETQTETGGKQVFLTLMFPRAASGGGPGQQLQPESSLHPRPRAPGPRPGWMLSRDGNQPLRTELPGQGSHKIPRQAQHTRPSSRSPSGTGSGGGKARGTQARAARTGS